MQRNSIKETLNKYLREATLLNEITIKDAWTKFYSDKTKFPALEGNEELFNSLNTLYSTNDNFNKGIFNWLYSLRKNNQLKDEDFYKAKEYIRLFNKFINKIPKEKRDLTKIKSLPELYEIIKDFSEDENNIATSNTQEIKDIKQKEIEKVFEDSQWLIMVPLTERASCLIGKGTQWCTAADKSNNLFDRYNNEGPLYVLIDKLENNKYQIHFETDSLMDERDSPVPAAYFFDHIVDDNRVLEFFENNIPTFWEFVLTTSVESVADGGYYEIFNKALDKAKDVDVIEQTLSTLRSSSYPEAIYTGFMYEENLYNISKYDVNNLIEYVEDEELKINVLNHLISMEYDFDDNQSELIKTYIAGKKLLDDHNLEINKEYKIDKGRYLKILRIGYEDLEPKFKIQIDKNVGHVDIETLLNYLHQGLLFETRRKSK